MLFLVCVWGFRYGYFFFVFGKREGEFLGRKEGKLVSFNFWFLFELGFRMEGDCWCQGWEWFQQKVERLGFFYKRKKVLKVQEFWFFSFQFFIRKSVKYYYKKGILEGFLVQVFEVYGLVLFCFGYRVRRGRVLS